MAKRFGDGKLPEAGVPLGGLGAGCIEMGIDGRFRNITINNNRTAETRIDKTLGSFLAVRANRKGRVSARILQSASDLPWTEAGINPPLVTVEQLAWRGLYPTSSYGYADPAFPLAVEWTAFAPVIPFDVEASTTPAILLTATVKNTTDDHVEASFALNWENICGCTRVHWTQDRGGMKRILVPFKTSEGSEEEAVPIVAGIECGKWTAYRSNAEGNYCIAARPTRDVTVSICNWNEMDGGALEAMWHAFLYDGALSNAVSDAPGDHMASVCCTATVPPRGTQTMTFTVAWYAPRFEVGGRDLGNGYCNRFTSAKEIGLRTLNLAAYFTGAVRAWHKRMLDSTLPRWMPRLLINSLHPMSTNTVYTKDGAFHGFECPAAPHFSPVDRRFYGSLAQLLLFPDLELREMDEIARAPGNGIPPRTLGGLEAVGGAAQDIADLGPKFILMAYRNFAMTGRRVQLEHVWPRVQETMKALLALDTDGDGLPEWPETRTTFEDWSFAGTANYPAGLYIAALRAYMLMCKALGQKADAKELEPTLLKALDSYPEQLWDEANGYFRFCPRGDARETPADVCHDGQLAGAWYADTLCLGKIVPPEMMRRACDTIRKFNDTGQHVLRGVLPGDMEWSNASGASEAFPATASWPAHTLTEYACAQIRGGRADRGLYGVQRIYESIYIKGKRQFDHPLQWNAAAGTAEGFGKERHLSAPAAWHVLLALQGFFLDVPHQTLWLRPKLPLNVHALQTPLFTPLTLGDLSYKETPGRPYQQQVRIAFDSPVPVRTVVLAIPAETAEVSVELVNDGTWERCEWVTGFDQDEHLVEIIASAAMMVKEGLEIRLREAPPGEASKE